MKKFITLIGLATVFSMLALAGSWSGKLLDAACYDQNKKSAECAATATTTVFAIEATDKVFKLDDTGNSKAAAALKNRADRSADPSKPQSKEVMAQVTGDEKNGVITVETIEVR